MKIVSVEAIPVRLPRERAKALGTAGSPTAVSGAGPAYRWSETVRALYPLHFETALVKLTTDAGLCGWGEAQAPLAPEVACTIIDLLLKPVLLDTPFDGSLESIERLWDRMYATMRVRGQTGGFMLDAISGVDLALWDLAGKAAAQPVSKLISAGAARDPVNAYLSGVPGADVAERVAAAGTHWGEGFRCFKLFHSGGRTELLETIDSIRTAFGGEAEVAVDALWRLSLEEAIELGGELDSRSARWLEAPLPPEDALAHGELARRIRTPLALGESYRTRYELAPFFHERALGFVQPDLGRCGLTEGLRIARMAAGFGVPVVPHLSIALGPQIAAAIHFAAAASECRSLEYNPSVLEIANRYVQEPLTLAGAAYTVPAGPGLGVEIKEAELRKAILPAR